jgi:hypothetical protein
LQTGEAFAQALRACVGGGAEKPQVDITL